MHDFGKGVHLFTTQNCMNFVIFFNIQMPFDPTMTKKKKKKKKVPFDLDAAMGETEGAPDGAPPEVAEQTEEVEESKPEKEIVDDGIFLNHVLNIIQYYR